MGAKPTRHTSSRKESDADPEEPASEPRWKISNNTPPTASPTEPRPTGPFTSSEVVTQNRHGERVSRRVVHCRRRGCPTGQAVIRVASPGPESRLEAQRRGGPLALHERSGASQDRPGPCTQLCTKLQRSRRVRHEERTKHPRSSGLQGRRTKRKKNPRGQCERWGDTR